MTKYIFSILSLLSLCLYVYAVPVYLDTENDMQESATFMVESGDGLHTVAGKLSKQGFIKTPDLFSLHVLIRRQSGALKAGEYIIPPHSTPEDIITILTNGKTIQHAITVPEGLTVHEIKNIVTSSSVLSGNISIAAVEGTLLPETYNVTRDTSRDAFLQRMQNDMTALLTDSWGKRSALCDLKSMDDVIILASIVEKETPNAHERPHVAGVYLNRLRKGMPLQADPTVIYAKIAAEGTFEGPLLLKDLKIDSAFNTYLNAGLPPTAICNPGRASIEAVLHPDETDDLFFVADGTGGHVFAKTYREHQKNHQKWRKIRKSR
ncbi:MAG: endolytic transglycosylase MltG [Alphaproteobacteria bacterium]